MPFRIRHKIVSRFIFFLVGFLSILGITSSIFVYRTYHTKPVTREDKRVLQACQATPRDIMLVIDTSNSMENGKLTNAKNAAQSFLNLLSQRGSTSRVGIASFDEEHGKVNQHLSNNYGTVSTELWKLNLKGTKGTCLECALLDTKTQNDVFREFQNNSVNTSKAVIILSDGNINRYIKNNNPNKGKIFGDNVSKSEIQGNNALNVIKSRFAPSVWVVHYGTDNVGYIRGFPSGQGQYIQANSGTLTNAFTTIVNTIQPACAPTATPTTPQSPGSISGSVFLDQDVDNVQDPNERTFTEAVTMQFSYTAPRVIHGVFSYTNLLFRNYILKIVPPDGYKTTGPDSYSITLNSNGTCVVVPAHPGISCSNGNLTRLTIGVTNVLPWFQATDASLKNELTGVINHVPTTTSCGPYTIADSPGVIYSGNQENSFENGNASVTNWHVSGEGTIQQRNIQSISYEGAESVLKSNATPINQFPCASTECSITNATLATGAYKRIGDVTLNTVTLTDKKVVLLVQGNVTINGPITVSPGAFLFIGVTGNITVTPTVGSALNVRSCTNTVTTPQLQGIFSTDNNFILEGNASCPRSDRQVHIAGSITTNAGRKSNSGLINRRTLCADNARYPVLTIRPRLDMLLYMPEFFMRKSTTWEEITP